MKDYAFFVPKNESFNYKKEFGYIGATMVLFFVMYVVGLIYSDDLEAGNRALQNKIPFLIFSQSFFIISKSVTGKFHSSTSLII